MQFEGFDILEVDLPFRLVFGHSLAKRKGSTNLFVRARLKGEGAGYGESVPRSYVTGETVSGAAREIEESLSDGWWRRSFDSLEDVEEALETLYAREGPGRGGAARCALELALLDAVGKSEGRSCMELLGGVRAQQVEYSAVLPFVRHPLKLFAMCVQVRNYKMRTAKVKVGQGAALDLRTLAFVRWAVGRNGDLRVDGNCCWSADEALEALKPMIRRGIKAVEQPLPADDLNGLARVAAAIEPKVIIDESFHTLEDARRAMDRGACDALNIRVSKCGGLLTSRRIMNEARDRGIRSQMGAQVGESGVLTAAGRAFACAYPDLLYREGSGGRFLLREDLTFEDTTAGLGGMSPALPGPGLGVTVDEERLVRHGRALASIR